MKNNSQQERVFRLRWLPEDDTIFFERTTVIFGTVVYCRSGVGAPGRFFFNVKDLVLLRGLNLCPKGDVFYTASKWLCII